MGPANSTPSASGAAQVADRYKAFDMLATLVAVVASEGTVMFVNAALEDARGLSRRVLVGSHFPDSFAQPAHLQAALLGAKDRTALTHSGEHRVAAML